MKLLFGMELLDAPLMKRGQEFLIFTQKSKDGK